MCCVVNNPSQDAAVEEVPVQSTTAPPTAACSGASLIELLMTLSLSPPAIRLREFIPSSSACKQRRPFSNSPSSPTASRPLFSRLALSGYAQQLKRKKPPTMPRLVRRKPLAERLKAYLNPLDFLLYLSEEFETRDWDTHGFATTLGLSLNFVFLLARANSGRQVRNVDDVFGDSGGAGWLGWVVSCSSSSCAFSPCALRSTYSSGFRTRC